MITRVVFKKYKVLADVDVFLEPFTVFVGPNNSGKSMILDVLYGFGDWLIGVVRGRPGWGYSDDVFSKNYFRNFKVVCENWSFERQDDVQGQLCSVGESEKRFLPSWCAQFHVNPANIRYNDGKQLAFCLSELADEFFDFVESAVKAVIPRVGRIVLEKSSDGVFLLFIETIDGVLVPVDDMGDGLIFVLGIFTAFGMAQQKRLGPGLILIDGIEGRLHPMSQQALIEQIRKIMKRQPSWQIIATTHSPYLLDHFRAEEVRLMKPVANEQTGLLGYTVEELVKQERYEEYTAGLSVGEIWGSMIADSQE